MEKCAVSNWLVFSDFYLSHSDIPLTVQGETLIFQNLFMVFWGGVNGVFKILGEENTLGGNKNIPDLLVGKSPPPLKIWPVCPLRTAWRRCILLAKQWCVFLIRFFYLWKVEAWSFGQVIHIFQITTLLGEWKFQSSRVGTFCGWESEKVNFALEGINHECHYVSRYCQA